MAIQKIFQEVLVEHLYHEEQTNTVEYQTEVEEAPESVADLIDKQWRRSYRLCGRR